MTTKQEQAWAKRTRQFQKRWDALNDQIRAATTPGRLKALRKRQDALSRKAWALKRKHESAIKNPSRNAWKPGKWIKASAVRVRKVAGRVVMDIKKAI